MRAQSHNNYYYVKYNTSAIIRHLSKWQQQNREYLTPVLSIKMNAWKLYVASLQHIVPSKGVNKQGWYLHIMNGTKV